jgi:glycosyltransferase involved in cell wall biosynthesis
VPRPVSIIVPNYNYGRYLDERLRSLLDQTFTDFELLILDDASTDYSREIIDRYASDPRARAVCYETRSGSVYPRWNDGARLASGKYLLFANADDSCEPRMVERLVAALAAAPGAGLAYVRSRIIDENGSAQSLNPAAARWDRDFVSTAAEELPYLLDQQTIPTASAVMIRRGLFERLGGFDTSLALAADHMLWARVLRETSFAYVAEPLNHFRTHGRTVRATTSRAVAILERYRVYGYVLGAFQITGDDRQRLLERLARNWIECWRQERGSGQWAVHRSIYKAARAVDPAIRTRFGRLWMESATGVRVRGPRAVARYAWRMLRD